MGGNDKGVSKKKKKLLADDENQVEMSQSLIKEEQCETKQKEKKVKNKSVQIKPENIKLEKEEQAGKNKVPKKSKKEKNSNLVVNKEDTLKPVKEKKKKQKKMVAMDGLSANTKDELAKKGLKLKMPKGENHEVDEVKVKKKKKKKDKTKEDGNEVETPAIKGNNERSKALSDKNVENDKMFTEKDKSIKSEIVIIEDGQTEVKRKVKTEKGGKASVEVSDFEDMEPKKKKRKKAKSKGDEAEPLSFTGKDDTKKNKQSRETHVTVTDDITKKSKKKSSSVKKQVENGVGIETGAKKRKIKEEMVEEPQERRQALQMEIDKASQPEKPAKHLGLGQWSTAQFDSSEQQQKFLRLMGGFKKGFQSAAVSAGGANMAMGKGAQQQLQQGLLGEFERAHSRQMDFSNRGAGLGFTAPSNKKFSIDINSRRSVRFDE
nr:lysine-rich nucleolar protein 1 [Monopterus albus]